MLDLHNIDLKSGLNYGYVLICTKLKFTSFILKVKPILHSDITFINAANLSLSTD